MPLLLATLSPEFWNFLTTVVVNLIGLGVVWIKVNAGQRINSQENKDLGDKLAVVDDKVNGHLTQMMEIARETSDRDAAIAHNEGFKEGTAAEIKRQDGLPPDPPREIGRSHLKEE